MIKLNIIFFALFFTSCASKNVKIEKEGIIAQDISYQYSSSSSTIAEEKDDKPLSLYSNKPIQKWINYFTKKDSARFQRFLDNGAYYREVIQTTLEEEGLPHELYYLALIESGFNTSAHSHAGAVGPWQFIKGTAKRYGLGVNSYIDERRDPILSTEAATKYLKDLYNVFNSWELAMAAYNCGELRVLRAIMKGKSRDFWVLSEKKLLPRETRNYVPKLLAAALIGNNLIKYGFRINNIDSFPDVESVEVPGGITLSEVAKLLKQDPRDLIHINQSLKIQTTPVWSKSYQVWVYEKDAKLLESSYALLAKNRSWKSQQVFPSYHRVRRGENLGRIARKYKVSINRLKRINNISGSRILIGQKIWLRSKNYKRVKGEKFYFVKRGDFIASIARKFKVRVDYLKKLNGIHSNRIYIGQKLDVTPGIKAFKYRVRKGDTLNRIARLYRTTIWAIKKKNALRNSRIYSGQVLKI